LFKMKLVALFLAALAVHQVESHFFGPVAVGFGVGLVSLRRQFTVAPAIVSRRSSRQYSLSTFYQSTPYTSFGYSTRTYTEVDHFHTPNHRAYYQPNLYHYHSTPWGPRLHHFRKRREAEALRSGRNARFNNNNVDINSLPVNRISSLAENVTAGFKDEVWYSDMSFKDRDDCSKRLICELNAKMSSNPGSMAEDEKAIAQAFGKGEDLDIGQETMDFDIASFIGKNIGKSLCERRYRRCETSVDRMMQMIRIELQDMQTVEDEVNNGAIDLSELDNVLESEKDEVDRIKEFDLFRTTTQAPPTTTTKKYYPAQQQVWGVGSVVAGTLTQ